MECLVGTSGFSYREWKGPFYPEDLPASAMLAHYAGRLGAVEINNTFYRLPNESTLRGWAEQVPDGFRFVIKASRRITHFARLGPKAEEPTAYLTKTVGALGDRLGALLFQLPPNFPADPERLETFLEWLPAGCPAAFEFRHASWGEDGVRRLLAGRGFSVVAADTEEEPVETLSGEPDWGYLRLRRLSYDSGELRAWAERVVETGWKRAYVFFKHEDAGAGPLMAEAFAREVERLGADAGDPGRPAPG